MSNPSEAVPATIWIEASSEQSMAVDGPDAKSWLNGMLSCDVKKVSTGRGVYGLALSKTGKIQTDCNVIATSSGVVFSVAADISLFNYFDQLFAKYLSGDRGLLVMVVRTRARKRAGKGLCECILE